MFECIICKITCSTVSNYRKHLKSKTHLKEKKKTINEGGKEDKKYIKIELYV